MIKTQVMNLNYFHKLVIKKLRTTGYHPLTNERTEQCNTTRGNI